MNPVRIAWVPPHGTIDRASYRLECYYPHLWLGKSGFESTVLEQFPTPADKDKYDLLIWFRTDHPQQAFDSGIPVIFFLTDGPLPSVMHLEQAKWLVTDCDSVHAKLSDCRSSTVCSKITHIPDTFDPPSLTEISKMRLHKAIREKPKLCWVGSQGGYEWARETIEHLRKEWTVEVISDHAAATKKWSRDTVFSDIMDCDIGIIPFPTGLKFGDTGGFDPITKDINRVVLMQAAGLPVIAAPLPAYKNYIRNGVDGLIADGPHEFEACVSLYEVNPQAMRSMADAGWLRAWTTASSPFTGNRWKQLLNDLAGR